MMAVSRTLAYAHDFRMLLNFVLSVKSTKYTKLNRVRKFLHFQYCDQGHVLVQWHLQLVKL